MSTLEFSAGEGAAPRRGALRRLWQRLPQNTRTQILFDVSRILAPLPDTDPPGGFPLAIAGLISTASGVGEGARLAYASLDAAGYAPAAFVGEVLEGFVIDTDHWRHFFLLLGMIWGLAAATFNHSRGRHIPLPAGRFSHVGA